MVTSVTTYVNSWSKYCSLSPAGKCEREPTASPYQCRQCRLINMWSVRSAVPFECRRHRKTGEHGLRTMAHLDSDHQPPDIYVDTKVMTMTSQTRSHMCASNNANWLAHHGNLLVGTLILMVVQPSSPMIGVC